MTTHELKTWPEPYTAIVEGRKRHEVRTDDRHFAVGDTLYLREWDNRPGYERFTGRECLVRVTYLTPGGAWGLPAGLCVMSISDAEGSCRFDCDECGDGIKADEDGLCTACGGDVRIVMDARVEPGGAG